MNSRHDLQQITASYLHNPSNSAMRSATLTLLICLLTVGSAWAQHPDRSQELPAHFVANRIYVRPVTTRGDTLRLFTDTGGGQILLKPTVERLKLPIRDTAVVRGRPTPVTTLPNFRSDATIPRVSEDRVYVFPPGRQATFLKVGDGMLGRGWFAGRVWTFDYAEKELLLHPSTEEPSFDPAHTVPLGFKTDSTGRRVEHFPSVEATIDGETYAFLFDTGASMVLTDSAHTRLGGPSVRGASFITASIFDKWRTQHPDWPVMENLAVSGPVIEVPKVTIAGHTVGPVRFTRRPDRNFHLGMSSVMDRRVEGALGGSLFQYFAITADYPGARALFQRTE